MEILELSRTVGRLMAVRDLARSATTLAEHRPEALKSLGRAKAELSEYGLQLQEEGRSWIRVSEQNGRVFEADRLLKGDEHPDADLAKAIRKTLKQAIKGLTLPDKAYL